MGYEFPRLSQASNYTCDSTYPKENGIESRHSIISILMFLPFQGCTVKLVHLYFIPRGEEGVQMRHTSTTLEPCQPAYHHRSLPFYTAPIWNAKLRYHVSTCTNTLDALALTPQTNIVLFLLKYMVCVFRPLQTSKE